MCEIGHSEVSAANLHNVRFLSYVQSSSRKSEARSSVTEHSTFKLAECFLNEQTFCRWDGFRQREFPTNCVSFCDLSDVKNNQEHEVEQILWKLLAT